MTRLLTFLLLLSFLLLPGGYAHSDQQGAIDRQCASLNRLPADFFRAAYAEAAQFRKAAGHDAGKPDHGIKAIEAEEEEDPASSKDHNIAAVTAVMPNAFPVDPFISNQVADQLPPGKHLSYSSPAFILFCVIRV